jgi:hypothetical protein
MTDPADRLEELGKLVPRGCYMCGLDKDTADRGAAEIRRLRERLMLPLLFHAGGRPAVEAWESITGTREMTTRVMCDSIREALHETGQPDRPQPAREGDPQ